MAARVEVMSTNEGRASKAPLSLSRSRLALRMDQLDIEEAGDVLLSLKSTDVDHERALVVLERLLASLALLQPPEQQPLLDAFLSLQDSFQHNRESLPLVERPSLTSWDPLLQ